ncbi:MAG: aldolase/citrate lyase family protein [Dehalococcoidales bacterium]|nr:aldolase/citrate lyase family protein [Dehalococcoidales bacterium]
MIKNNMKKKIREGKVAIGAWVDLPAPELVEMAGHMGFDFVIVEHEHAARNLAQLEDYFRAADAANIPAMVRTKDNSPGFLQHIMDAGAMGVFLAMTKTKEDIAKAVRGVKYPPIGGRGHMRCLRSDNMIPDKMSWPEYAKDANENTMVFALVENVEGVKNIDEIASVEGLDGIQFGPADFSVDAGIPEQYDTTLVKDARNKVSAACKKHGKILWFPLFGPFGPGKLAEMGGQMLTVRHDKLLIYEAWDALLKNAKTELKQ